MESEPKFTFSQISMLRLGRNNLMLELKAQISCSLSLSEIGALPQGTDSPAHLIGAA